MTKLASAIEMIRDMPEDRQDLAADLLLNLVSGEAFPIEPDAAHLAEIELAKSEADAGDFASDDDVSALWKKHRG